MPAMWLGADELSGLPAGPIADAAKPWLDRAKAGSTPKRRLIALQGDAIAALAAGGAQ